MYVPLPSIKPLSEVGYATYVGISCLFAMFFDG